MQANRASDTGGSRGLQVVTVDPGHGGRQPGAVGPTGLMEKDVCLAVALQVRDLLRGQVDVRLTRDTDVDVPLGRRQAAPGSTCYVSIHCNAFPSPAANGTETFHIKGREADQRLAQVLQKHMLARLQLRNRGVKTALFQVIRQARIPAVLVELAFISNSAEEQLLRSGQGQTAAAKAIADGIIEFLGESAVRPPPTPARPPPPAPAARERRAHTVVSGDTVWGISRQYGVTTAQLQQWNGLVPASVLRVGQVLLIE